MRTDLGEAISLLDTCEWFLNCGFVRMTFESEREEVKVTQIIANIVRKIIDCLRTPYDASAWHELVFNSPSIILQIVLHQKQSYGFSNPSISHPTSSRFYF